MRRIFLGLLLAGLGSLVWAQPAVFKLQLPELGQQLYDSDVIDVAGDPRYVSIHMLNPVAADVDYGRIQTRLNGEGAVFITTSSPSPEGKIVRLDLKLRESMKLVPGPNSIEIRAINKRGRAYYRNFLLRTPESRRNEYFTYDSRRAPGANNRPLEISLVEPDLPVVIGAAERSKMVRVKGSVSSPNPLQSVRIAGKELRANDFETEVRVTPNDRSIVIEAFDSSGNSTALKIPVSQAAKVKPKLDRDRYALVIGISKYGGKGPPPLASAAGDARDFAAALTTRAGFPSENVLIIADAQATHEQLRGAFRSFLARAGPDDLLLVFFAGYGLHDPNDPSNLYLAAHDTEIGRIPETAISIDQFKVLIQSNVRSRQAVFLFDVNHKLENEWSTANNNLINGYLLRLFPGDAAKAVMVGSSLSENSGEREGRGLFARKLIETAGTADANQDGVVSAREWFQAASRAVQQESAGVQTPRFTLAPAERPLFAAN